jgi:Subunit ChlI of Mg-chelatase
MKIRSTAQIRATISFPPDVYKALEVIAKQPSLNEARTSSRWRENISCKCYEDKTTFCSVMPSKVYSAAVVGVEAFEVEIEVHAGWGNTDKIAVVGLPDTAVKESKDRVTSAISNSSLRWPYGKRITINLAPADVRKEGPSFDLPIALGMLKLEENNRLPALDAFCISGELALSGQLRPVKGVLSIALEAKRRHRQTLIVPADNAAETAVVEGVEVYGASNIQLKESSGLSKRLAPPQERRSLL